MARKLATRRGVLQGTGAGIAVGLAGCLGGGDGGDGGGGGGGGDGGGGTEDPADLPAVHFLTDYNNDAWQSTWEEDLIPTFTDETGIDVNVEYSGMSGQQEGRLATLIQSGDPPDINTSTFDQVADLWANDQLSSVNDVLDQVTGVAGDLVNEPFTDGDGDTYQVSHGYYVSDFQYREDVYDELGLDVPEDFQTVIDNAKAIEESDMDIRGYGLAGGKTGKSQDEFQVYLQHMGVPGNGLRWKDPEAREELEIHFPEDEVVTLLEFFKELSQYSPDPTSIGWASSISNYIGGQFAQQYHLNIWPIGLAAATGAPSQNSGVAPLPYWDEGGIGPDQSWAWEATPDGHHVFSGGENTPGAKEWLSWLYGDSMERTANMYAAEPSRFLPNYEDVVESEPFQNIALWQEFPELLEKLKYCQNTIVADHYGNVEAANTDSPVSLYVTRQWFYGEMVNQVVTDSSTPQEAYDWGYGRLETRLQEARDRFGDA